MQVAFEIGAIFLLLVANGVFAMSEIAVVTARQSRLEGRAERGEAKAAKVLRLKEEPTDFLSTVQIGITLIGILAGAFGGARLSAHLVEPLSRLGWFGSYADTVAFVIVVASITYMSLVIGELVPKRIALTNPEGIAGSIAGPMGILSRITRPLVAVLSASTTGVTKLLGIRGSDDPDVTEEDIRSMIARGARSGVVHETEEDILERVFYLGDRQVRAVMTPRPDMDWIEPGESPARIREVLERSQRAGLLVCEGNVDQVLGVVRATDMLSQCLSGTPMDLTPLLRQPHFVPVSLPLLKLLKLFRQSDVHVAIALDEFGSVQGVATLSDVLDDLVADIPGRVGHDSDIVRREDGSWLIDGTVPLEDVEHAIGGKLVPLDQPRRSRTLGGLLLNELGRLPAEGDTVQRGHFLLEVMDMDGRRVDRVLVQQRQAGPTAAEESD